MKKISILLVGLLLSFISEGRCAVFYISQSVGNDLWSGLAPEWDGTDGPKKTLLAAQNIISNATPGTQVLLKKGDTWKIPAGGSGISLSGANGSAANPVVLGNYGTGNSPVLDVQTSGTVIFMRGSNESDRSAHVVIDGLHLTTSLSPGERPGVGFNFIETLYTYGPHHITVRNCVVENLASGILAQGLAHDILIENSIVRNNYKLPPETGHSQGAYINIVGFTLRNNLFECNGKNLKCGAAEDSWFDHNIYLSHCQNCLVENNTFRHALDGMKIRKGENIIIRGNTVHDMDLMGLTAGADGDEQLNDTIIEGNEIYDTSIGIAIKDQSGGAGYINNMIIRNNIIRNPKIGPTYGVGSTYSFLTSSYSNSILFYNNLFTGLNSRIGFSINSNAKTNVVMKNNIFSGDDKDHVLINLPPDISNIQLDHNLYYDNVGGDIINWNGEGFANVGTFSSKSGREANGLQGDPGLRMNYSLKADSIARDAGANAAGYVDYDILGAKRPHGPAWDIGPYEYPSGSFPWILFSPLFRAH